MDGEKTASVENDQLDARTFRQTTFGALAMRAEFNVLTYNIHKGINASNRRYVLQHIQLALTHADADIVILQEIVDTHDRFERRFSDWIQMPQFHFLARNGWEHVAFGENAVYRHGSHGNAILSRFPIHKWRNIDITRNRFEQRGVLHVEIDLPKSSEPLHVCSVHLNLLGRDRRKQLAALSQHVASTIPDNAPLVIGGDFNDWRKRASNQLLNGIGVSESHKALHGRYARTFPAWRPVFSLDRIYYKNLNVKNASALEGDPWRALSDHLPVVAGFESVQT